MKIEEKQYLDLISSMTLDCTMGNIEFEHYADTLDTINTNIQKIVENPKRQPLKVDKDTKKGHPQTYYDCPHCKEDYSLMFLDDFCRKCGGQVNWI